MGCKVRGIDMLVEENEEEGDEGDDDEDWTGTVEVSVRRVVDDDEDDDDDAEGKELD